jgi:hypothetical protein
MATKHHFPIDQGTTFEMDINLNDENGDELDTTGWSARGKFRKHFTSSNSVSFTTAIANGSLTLTLTAAQTANVVAGRYVYDIELVDDSSQVYRILEGIVTIRPEATR